MPKGVGIVRSVEEINDLGEFDFGELFGDVAEQCPWVAAIAGRKRPFDSREIMVAAFAAAMNEASHDEKLGLIRAHPDLAGRAHMAEASVSEQAGVGLDKLSAEEFARFTQLNTAYKAKFGFPFIFAVKGATKEQILAAFETRLPNDTETEFRTALGQIERIFRFRIEDRVAP